MLTGPPRFIDAHLHLDLYSPEFRSLCLNQKDILYFNSSLDGESFTQNKEWTSPGVLTGFGVHPMRAAMGVELPDNWLDLLGEASFLGETGLDYHWVEDRRGDKVQRDLFATQLEGARSLGKAQQIHSKGAELEVLQFLTSIRPGRSLIHWYSGPVEYIKPLLDLGCYFTLGPDLLIGKSGCAGIVPVDRILIETDGPDSVPWLTGESADSGDIRALYQKSAEIYKIDLEDWIEKIWENAEAWLGG